jgi:hypothetical protein
MSYLIAEVDICHRVESLEINASHSGVAVIVRRSGRPIGFFMKPVAAGSVLALASETLERWIESEIDPDLLRGRTAKPFQVIFRELPSLTVAVCTRDRSHLVERCLASIERIRNWGRHPFRSIEVLLIDNAPSDERTKAFAKSQSQIRYILEPMPGLDFARNRAAQEASGDLIAYLDDDVVVDAG